MRKPPPLSDAQREALDLARRQGGKLYRTPMGWGPQHANGQTAFAELHNHATVRALVTRKAMEWSATNGTQWTEARLVEVRT